MYRGLVLFLDADGSGLKWASQPERKEAHSNAKTVTEQQSSSQFVRMKHSVVSLRSNISKPYTQTSLSGVFSPSFPERNQSSA
ncbi:hypothetical protein AOLI_G00091240 [Acnodon oligacanthus]